MLVVLILIAWAYQVYGEINEAGFALQLAIFNVISIVTGTGYATTDYGLVGRIFADLLFLHYVFGRLRRIHILRAKDLPAAGDP